jgi:hypothetical protein
MAKKRLKYKRHKSSTGQVSYRDQNGRFVSSEIYSKWQNGRAYRKRVAQATAKTSAPSKKGKKAKVGKAKVAPKAKKTAKKVTVSKKTIKKATAKKAKSPVAKKKAALKEKKPTKKQITKAKVAEQKRKQEEKKKQAEFEERIKGEKPKRKGQLRRAFKLGIDQTEDISSLDFEKAKEEELKSEMKRLKGMTYRLRKKTDRAKDSKEKDVYRSQLARVVRVLQKIDKLQGTYKKPKAMLDEAVKKDTVTTNNVYRWEGKEFIHGILNSNKFDTYNIEGLVYQSSEIAEIEAELDRLDTYGTMRGQYYFVIKQYFGTRKVVITLP